MMIGRLIVRCLLAALMILATVYLAKIGIIKNRGDQILYFFIAILAWANGKLLQVIDQFFHLKPASDTPPAGGSGS